MRQVRIARMALIVGLLMSTSVLAQSPFNPQASMRDNLAALQAAKKQVNVVLKNGEKYQANIGSLGDAFVVLTQPAQKEFYDVLVPLDEIAAVEARAR